MTDLHGVDEPASSDESGLQATDALLDALAAGVPVVDDPAAALLSALVADLSEAEPVVAPTLLAPRRSRRRLAPRTGIAAVAVIGVLSTGGVAAASVSAGPTSALFPLHQVLTGQPQLDGSQRQALEVKRKLRSAAKALAAGHVSRAAQDVGAAQGRLPKIKPGDGQGVLAAQVKVLTRQVSAGAAASPTLSPPAKPVHTRTPSPAPTGTAGRTSTSPAPPTTTPVPTSSQPPTTAGSPVVGGAPGTQLTSPAPTSPGSTPSTQPSTSTPSPSRSASGTPTSASPTATPTTGGGKHHRPGKGTSGTPAPGSPPAPSMVPPSAVPSADASSAPITVPPATVTPQPSAS